MIEVANNWGEAGAQLPMGAGRWRSSEGTSRYESGEDHWNALMQAAGQQSGPSPAPSGRAAPAAGSRASSPRLSSNGPARPHVAGVPSRFGLEARTMLQYRNCNCGCEEGKGDLAAPCNGSGGSEELVASAAAMAAAAEAEAAAAAAVAASAVVAVPLPKHDRWQMHAFVPLPVLRCSSVSRQAHSKVQARSTKAASTLPANHSSGVNAHSAGVMLRLHTVHSLASWPPCLRKHPHGLYPPPLQASF